MMKKIKELFATPKKAVITSVCVLGGLAVLGTGTSFATAAVAKNQSIGIEGAQTAVLADAGVANKLFTNMSTRMAQSIRDDLEITSNVRMKDVEAAQQRIVDIIRALEEKNEIIILKGGKDDIIA